MSTCDDEDDADAREWTAWWPWAAAGTGMGSDAEGGCGGLAEPSALSTVAAADELDRGLRGDAGGCRRDAPAMDASTGEGRMRCARSASSLDMARGNTATLSAVLALKKSPNPMRLSSS
jgi:hypothetical protein